MPKTFDHQKESDEAPVEDDALSADHPEPDHVAEEEQPPADEPTEAAVEQDADEVTVKSSEARVVSIAGFPTVEVGPDGTEVARKHAEALALSVPSVEVAD